MITALQNRFTDRVSSEKKVVEVELAQDIMDIEIDYSSPTSGSTHRRVKPVGLKHLLDGQIAFAAKCRLRDDYRMFAFDRIQLARFPDNDQDWMRGRDLAQFFLRDMERLLLKDQIANGALSPQSGSIAPSYSPSPADKDVHIPKSAEGTIEALFNNLCQEASLFVKSIPTDASINNIAVMVTVQAVPGALPDVYIDTPNWVAEANRENSNHANVAYLLRRQRIIDTGRELYAQIEAVGGITHKHSSLTLLVRHTHNKPFDYYAVALDNIWINQINTGIASISSFLLAGLSRAPAPESSNTPLWLAETNEGLLHVRGEALEDAIRRIGQIASRPMRFGHLVQHRSQDVGLPPRKGLPSRREAQAMAVA